MSYCRFTIGCMSRDEDSHATERSRKRTLTSVGLAPKRKRGFIGGDVYLFASTSGGIKCCACRLMPIRRAQTAPEIKRVTGVATFDYYESAHLPDRVGAVAHMMEHLAARHVFPASTLDDLWRELLEVGNRGGLRLRGVEHDPMGARTCN